MSADGSGAEPLRGAGIRSASLEIRRLAVDGRKFSQALFRQIFDEQILDPRTQTPRGEPWGLINYFPEPCKPDHLHVIWQKESRIRRCCVYEDLDAGVERAYQDRIDRLDSDAEYAARSCIIDRVLAGSVEPAPEPVDVFTFSHRGRMIAVELNYGLDEEEPLDPLTQIITDPGRMDEYDSLGNYTNRQSLRIQSSQIKEELGTSSYEQTADLAAASVDESERLDAELRRLDEEHRRRYAELCALQQLFIGV